MKKTYLGLLPALMLATSCASAPPPASDNLVVPGERVGDVWIGMALADLLALKGTPLRTIPTPGTEATTYAFEGMTVAAFDQVYWIVAMDDRFQTAEGVGPGSEQIFTRATFGKPKCVVTQGASTIYDYGNVYFEVDNNSGKVEQVGVQKKTQTCRG